uniref:Unkown protein n=1 Tax=Riptortus pedestris TaxID=329032 RepID=R4WTR7_RIPPE|nr:unkown protein [Riptortus pedestris]
MGKRSVNYSARQRPSKNRGPENILFIGDVTSNTIAYILKSNGPTKTISDIYAH